MNYKEFSASIKQKYPIHKDIDDLTLSREMVKKYPTYANRVSFDDINTINKDTNVSSPEIATDVVKSSVMSALAAPLGIGLKSKEAQGVGQGAIQGLTFGYGMPALRKVTGVSTKEIPEPNIKEELVGNVLSLPAVSTIMPGMAGSKLAKFLPAILGYTYNPSNTNIEPVISKKRAMGAKLLGTALPAFSGVLKYTANKLPANIINSLIKPSIRPFLLGKNPGEAIVNEGIIGTSIEDLGKKTTNRLSELTDKLEETISNPKYKNTKIDLSDIHDEINKSIEKASLMPERNKEALNHLYGIRNDLVNVIKVTTNAPKQGFFSMKVNPEQALKIKRILGKATKFTGNPSDDALVNSTLKKTYHAIDDKLDKVIPETTELNDRISNLIGANTAIKHREIILNRNNVISLGSILAGISTGIYTHEPFTGLGGLLTYSAASSTPGKTILAQTVRGLRPMAKLSENVINNKTSGIIGGQIGNIINKLMKK